MATSAVPSYAGYRYPAEVISHAVWLYFRFPLSLRMVDELLATRGIIVSHETVRQWALKFVQSFANQIRRRLVDRLPTLTPYVTSVKTCFHTAFSPLIRINVGWWC